jgi:hypothetical protein
MEELLKKILAAQLAQLSLLQSISANVALHTRSEYGSETDKTAQWQDARKAVEAALEQLEQLA